MRKLTLWLMILLMVFSPILAEQVAYAPLREGDQGQAVKAMQQRLRELKLLTGKADGIYGPQTAQAVRALLQDDYDAQVFHANGAGGRTLAALAAAATLIVLLAIQPKRGAATG